MAVALLSFILGVALVYAVAGFQQNGQGSGHHKMVLAWRPYSLVPRAFLPLVESPGGTKFEPGGAIQSRQKTEDAAREDSNGSPLAITEVTSGTDSGQEGPVSVLDPVPLDLTGPPSIPEFVKREQLTKLSSLNRALLAFVLPYGKASTRPVLKSMDDGTESRDQFNVRHTATVEPITAVESKMVMGSGEKHTGSIDGLYNPSLVPFPRI